LAGWTPANPLTVCFPPSQKHALIIEKSNDGLVADGGQFLCVVRYINEAGGKAENAEPLRVSVALVS
jgi:hypothetical protein